MYLWRTYLYVATLAWHSHSLSLIISPEQTEFSSYHGFGAMGGGRSWKEGRGRRGEEGMAAFLTQAEGIAMATGSLCGKKRMPPQGREEDLLNTAGVAGWKVGAT